MRGEYEYAADRDLGRLGDEDRATPFEIADDVCIVDYLAADIDRRAKSVQRQLHDIDGTLDPGAERARVREYHVARCDGGEGPDALAEHPNGVERALAAVRNPNAGDVLVSAAPGYEFLDLAGRHHAGGGSHGSLVAGDSEVPMLTVGLGPPPERLTQVAPLLLDHLGVERPAYARELAHAR